MEQTRGYNVKGSVKGRGGGGVTRGPRQPTIHNKTHDERAGWAAAFVIRQGRSRATAYVGGAAEAPADPSRV
jgi:hypothetical protein